MSVNKKKKIRLGLERLLSEPGKYTGTGRVGLICNQATVDHSYRHAADLFHENGSIDLRALFGPQHGIRGDVQDNMVETSHGTDRRTGLPVHSLYSDTRRPTGEMLSEIDTLVFDLQDIGGRVYTFIYTMAYAMEACARLGKRFVVCDRPNPINGKDVEGALLEKGHESFVGEFPIPMRHGMTNGELALYFRDEMGLDCDLTIVPMEGWERDLYLDETDAPWVIPSPNMPWVETAVVFPGTVFFEGTQVSEGRGTTRPFEFVGAPYVDPHEYASALDELGLEGVVFRPTHFMPTFQKHAGTSCGGVFLHVTDRAAFRPVRTGIAMVRTVRDLYPEEFDWKSPPYEYEYERNPFDVIAGTKKLRRSIEAGETLDRICDWEKDLETFSEVRGKYLLY